MEEKKEKDEMKEKEMEVRREGEKKEEEETCSSPDNHSWLVYLPITPPSSNPSMYVLRPSSSQVPGQSRLVLRRQTPQLDMSL